MKLSHRIFLGYFLVVALAGVFLLISVKDELRPAVRQSMEETLVDTANLLAEIVEQDIRNNTIDASNFAYSMQDYLARRPEASIWGLSKNTTGFRVYITDYKGIVIYDSDSAQEVGQDYSQWNDVYLTLQGKYGARSTRANPKDSNTSTMYVAAPIRSRDNIIGVLTVGKPTLSIVPFIELSQRNILKAGVVLFIVALVLGWLFSGHIAKSTRTLANYANRVSKGEKAVLPNVTDKELSQLAQAMESMRVALEGKEYIENYIHSLTHEIKSPLSGISGASELLTEEMDREDQARFIHNIREDTRRLQAIVDRLLDLAKLEQQQELEQYEPIHIKTIIEEVILGHEAQLSQKSLIITIDIADSTSLVGDSFLIRQAVTNLLDNAIDFSPTDGTITIEEKLSDGTYTLRVMDQGSGIPDYAKKKIFERFYSLPRPDTGKKSSGLGLSFVREVMSLHGGDVKVESVDIGCCVSLTFLTK